MPGQKHSSNQICGRHLQGYQPQKGYHDDFLRRCRCNALQPVNHGIFPTYQHASALGDNRAIILELPLQMYTDTKTMAKKCMFVRQTGCSCCSTFHGERVHSASVALRTYSPEHFSKHLVDSWTPGHLDTTWTPPGHHLDITWTSPGHLLNTSWTPAHLVGIWWSPGHLVDTWWTPGGPSFDMTLGKKALLFL